MSGIKIFVASSESRNFSFEGVGTTPEQAETALKKAFNKHAKQYRIAKDWWSDLEITIREYVVGHGYRDAHDLA